MPTYRNAGPSGSDAKNLLWETVQVPPGGSIESYEILGSPFEKLNEEPRYNPVTANEVLAFAGAESKNARIVEPTQLRWAAVWQVTGCNVTVYLGSAANVPAWAVLRPGDSTVIPLNRSVERLILVSDGVGSCRVTQSSQETRME